MATLYQNLSNYNLNLVPSAAGFRFGIVVSEWNHEITSELLKGACQTLLRLGAKEDNISVHWVPGSFELIFGAKSIAQSSEVDAVLCLGCVIQGETPHFKYICQGVTEGIAHLNLQFNIPFIFGLLTTLNLEQAQDRAGGKLGNKGDEAAVTAVKMIHLKKSMIGNS
jgi:6,7-dimethyl-8-ribityllumazine synthase